MTKLLRLISLFCAIALFSAPQLAAEDRVWIQVEARPDAKGAIERARGYVSALGDVSAFRLRSGWYAIVTGPLSRQEALQDLRELRRIKQIPNDSFVAGSENFRELVWNSTSEGLVGTIQQIKRQLPKTDRAEIQAVEGPEKTETAGNSLAAKPVSQLTNTDLRDLQRALREFGVYQGPIDGIFGAGTRRAIAEWQGQAGIEATGQLSPDEAAALLTLYRAPMLELGLRPYRDEVAGITIDIPQDVLSFDRREAPFVHFKPLLDIPASLSLISQTGDRNRLRALYDMMQNLEIVPLSGDRTISNSRFIIEGANASITNYTIAWLKDGQIKGFSLVWPVKDEARRKRLVAHMRESFETLPSVLSDNAGFEQQVGTTEQFSGLALRQPARSWSGVFVRDDATVLTIAPGAEACAEITLERDHVAKILAHDPTNGLTLLTPTTKLNAIDIAQGAGTPRYQAGKQIALAGYSYGGALPAPSIKFGEVTSNRSGLELPKLVHLSASVTKQDFGGPILDQNGAIIGLITETPKAFASQSSLGFGLDAPSIARFLEQNGISLEEADTAIKTKPALVSYARDITALLECW